MLSTVIQLGVIQLVKVMLKLMKTCLIIINYLRQFMKVKMYFSITVYNSGCFSICFITLNKQLWKAYFRWTYLNFFNNELFLRVKKVKLLWSLKLQKTLKSTYKQYKIFKLSFHCFIKVYIILILPFTNYFQCFVFVNNIVIPFTTWFIF